MNEKGAAEQAGSRKIMFLLEGGKLGAAHVAETRGKRMAD